MPEQQNVAAGLANAEQWVTRREIAHSAGCSEDTVKRYVKANGFPTRASDRGGVLVPVADFVATGRLPAAVASAGVNAGQAAELKRAMVEIARLTAEVAELTGRLSATTAGQDVVIARGRHLREQVGQQQSAEVVRGGHQLTAPVGEGVRGGSAGDALREAEV